MDARIREKQRAQVAFHFTEGEWDAISAQLERTGRLRNDTDRQILETICGAFAHLRPKLGHNTPTPKKARDQWRKVATAARKLEAAIDGLRAAGAADFTILDNHKGEAKRWAAQLPLLKQNAEFAAELEMAGVRAVANTADPMLDGFVKQLVRVWASCGGRISHGDGPLLRFLQAVTSAALCAADERPMKTEALKHSIRRVRRVAS